MASFGIKLHGQDVAFSFPESGDMRGHLKAIFAGFTYPRADLLPGYAPRVVVDIGANVGASALWFMSFAPGMRVVCFEPSAENFGYLRSNLQALPGVELYHYGLFDRDCSMTLHLGKEQTMQHSVVASIETGRGTETIALRQASAEFDRLGLEQMSILKVDTEGCEIPILEDLGTARLDRVDQIYVEYHSETDRRAIDDLLGRRFILAHAHASAIHRGVNHYVARTLADATPQAAYALVRPR